MMGWFSKRRSRPRNAKQPAADPWDQSTPLIEWGDGSAWTIGDSYMGSMTLGATGSGKSTGSLAAQACAMLEAEYGGLFLCVKPEDRDTYVQYVRDAGRLDDLLIFSPDHLVRYNFIADEMANSASPLGLAENLCGLLMTAAELTERAGKGAGGGENEKYFRMASERLCRNGLLALVLSGRTITMPDLHRLIVSAPQSVEQSRSGQWRKESFCFECLSLADKANKSESLRADFALVLSFFMDEWPALSSRTRGLVQNTLTTTTDLLSRGAARDMLSAPAPNISPSMMYDGKIMIADFPVLLYRDVGQLIQVILKFMWQRAHARRDVRVNGRPTFIVADECQTLLVDADPQFQAIARSTRTAVVYGTQSISGLIDTFGPSSEAKVHTLLTNLQTRICHQQTDVKTVEYMQELIGLSKQVLINSNQSRDQDWLSSIFGSENNSGTTGFSESWQHELQAEDLNGLAKGGPPRWITEAIVYQGGKRFANGRRWLRVTIPQRIPGLRPPRR